MEHDGVTRFLFYDVIGQQCPSCKTVKNCGLRKRLQKLNDVEKLVDYKVLENGVISVSRFVNVGTERFVKVAKSTVFDFEIEKIRSCHACKEQAEQKENHERPGMQTIVYSHGFDYIHCPEEMNCASCPLRKELKAMEKKKSIGYKELDNGELLIPKGIYNPKNNTYQDLQYLQEQICSKCLKQQIR